MAQMTGPEAEKTEKITITARWQEEMQGPQSLKYRLKRIRALLGGDPSRGDLRLQVELALKLLDVPRLAVAAGAPAAVPGAG